MKNRKLRNALSKMQGKNTEQIQGLGNDEILILKGGANPGTSNCKIKCAVNNEGLLEAGLESGPEE